MATSKLQRQVSALLSVHLGQYTIRENHRPEWLEGLELDFYIEELDVGIEVQGQQHYAYTPHFHTSYADYLDLRDRDSRKAELCQCNEIKLFYIHHGRDILPLIEQLDDITLPQKPHPKWIAESRIVYQPRSPYAEKPKKAKDDKVFLRWMCKARFQADKDNPEKAKRYAWVAIRHAIAHNLILKRRHYSTLERILSL